MADFDEKYGQYGDKKYAKCINDIGIETFRQLIPWSDDELIEAYATDRHFNSIKLKEWDQIAGFHENTSNGHISQFDSKLKHILHNSGINSYAPSQLVCLLKETARISVENSMSASGKSI